MQYVKHLSEITPEVSATAERGARFHPIVGLGTPSGFTTSHPQDDTMMRETASPFSSDQERRLQSFLSVITHSACFQSSPLTSSPQSLLPYALSSCEVACGMITLVLVRPNASMDGWFTSPSLIKPSPYQPASHLIQGQRAAFGSLSQWSLNTVLILGGS
jgi:hypothetical protein